MHPGHVGQLPEALWETSMAKTVRLVGALTYGPQANLRSRSGSSHGRQPLMNTQDFQYQKAALRIICVMAAALATACASAPPPPLASLQAAQQAITTAEGVDAGGSAPGELAEARRKLQEANAAVKDGRMVSADRLALQSRASADLAAARTASAKAITVNTELRAGNAALAEELNRQGGVSR
jgi:hypothetical protein